MVVEVQEWYETIPGETWALLGWEITCIPYRQTKKISWLTLFPFRIFPGKIAGEGKLRNLWDDTTTCKHVGPDAQRFRKSYRMSCREEQPWVTLKLPNSGQCPLLKEGNHMPTNFKGLANWNEPTWPAQKLLVIHLHRTTKPQVPPELLICHSWPTIRSAPRAPAVASKSAFLAPAWDPKIAGTPRELVNT